MNPFTLNRKQRFWANFVLNSPGVKKIVVPSSGMLKALKEKKKYSNKFIVIPNSIRSKSVNKRAENLRKSLKFKNHIFPLWEDFPLRKILNYLLKDFRKVQ